MDTVFCYDEFLESFEYLFKNVETLHKSLMTHLVCRKTENSKKEISDLLKWLKNYKHSSDLLVLVMEEIITPPDDARTTSDKEDALLDLYVAFSNYIKLHAT